MAWTYCVNSITHSDTTLDVFGQLQFSGSYTAGGDNNGTIKIGGNTSGLSTLLQTNALHASQPPLSFGLQLDGGYLSILIAGSAATNFKLKLLGSSTGTELAAGAYPNALTSSPYHTLSLTFAKNL